MTQPITFSPPGITGSIRVISPLEFLNRFPADKLANIYAHMATDPNLIVLDRKVMLAQEVGLDDEKTVESLAYLKTNGYLSADDVTAILA
jgi:hypothetical protein